MGTGRGITHRTSIVDHTVAVSVIIVNHNGARYLVPCLTALERQTFRDFQVVMVDNASADGSVELVREQFPRVKVIVNRTNRGFAAANNQAIRATRSPFVVTLNNDTEPEPRWLEELMRVAAVDERVGSVASKMLFHSQPDIINSAGIALDRVGIAWDRLGGARDDPTEATPRVVFGACAGAALYRRAMLDDVGLFDEAFFMYHEDVDLAWRARLRGWNCLYAPSARVLHHHSATGVEGSPFKGRLLGRNKWWTVVKNYPAPALWYHLPLILGYDLASVLYATVFRRDISALRGRLWALRGLPVMLRARRQIQRRRTIGFGELATWFAPLEPPWAVLDRYRHLSSLNMKRKA